MKYTAKTFTVPASGKREDPCTHGWLDPRGRCVLCGETVQDIVAADPMRRLAQRAAYQAFAEGTPSPDGPPRGLMDSTTPPHEPGSDADYVDFSQFGLYPSGHSWDLARHPADLMDEGPAVTNDEP